MSAEAVAVLENLMGAVQKKLWAGALLRQLVRGSYCAGAILVLAGILHTQLLPIPIWQVLLLALLPMLVAAAPAILHGRPCMLDAARLADTRLDLHALLRSALEQAVVPGHRRAGAAELVIAQAAQAAPDALARVRRWPWCRSRLHDAIPVALAVAGLSLLLAPSATPRDQAALNAKPASAVVARPKPAFAELQPLLSQLHGIAVGARPKAPQSTPGAPATPHQRSALHPPQPQAAGTASLQPSNTADQTSARPLQVGAMGGTAGNLAGANAAASAEMVAKTMALHGPRKNIDIRRRQGHRGSNSGFELEPAVDHIRQQRARALAAAPARAPAGASGGQLAPHLNSYAAHYLAAMSAQK